FLDCRHHRAELLDKTRGDGVENLLASAEVVVERAGGHVGRGGDFCDRGALRTFFRHHSLGGLEKLFARLLSLADVASANRERHHTPEIPDAVKFDKIIELDTR